MERLQILQERARKLITIKIEFERTLMFGIENKDDSWIKSIERDIDKSWVFYKKIMNEIKFIKIMLWNIRIIHQMKY